MHKLNSSRKFILFAALILVFAMTAAFAVGCDGDDGFSVSEVQHDPFAFPGEITINGTVGMFSDDPNFFGVMDTNELLQCGQFDCGAWIMPTLFVGGSLPTIAQGDNVVLNGQFVNDGNGTVFQVTSMDVGNNIMDRLP